MLAFSAFLSGALGCLGVCHTSRPPRVHATDISSSLILVPCASPHRHYLGQPNWGTHAAPDMLQHLASRPPNLPPSSRTSPVTSEGSASSEIGGGRKCAQSAPWGTSPCISLTANLCMLRPQTCNCHVNAAPAAQPTYAQTTAGCLPRSLRAVASMKRVLKPASSYCSPWLAASMYLSGSTMGLTFVDPSSSLPESAK